MNVNAVTDFTISGSGFGTDTAKVKVRINGHEQSIQSVTDSLITAKSATCSPDAK